MNVRTVRYTLAWVLGCAAISHSGRCGMTHALETISGKGSAKSSARAAMAAAPSRLFETEHFAIRYVLRGLHQIRWDGSATLKRTVDSLFSAQPAGSTLGEAESAVYAALDTRGDPHPEFVTRAAAYLESAWTDYVGKLGMRNPAGAGPSVLHGGSARNGRYPVDIGDLGTFDSFYNDGDYYGLTYPAGQGGMLLENDFLTRAHLNADGITAGDPIRSKVGDRVFRNYAVEWDLGLKVTCFHEFYHAVQFAYVPNPSFPAHFWFEASATGMEERNAGEVNDYLQYLPAFLGNLDGNGIFSNVGVSQYGCGIFHVYLASALGETFDVRVWEALAANGNDPRAALVKACGRYSMSFRDVFADFAARLSLPVQGTGPYPPFSPDMESWPKLLSDSLSFNGAEDYASPNMPPGSIRLMALGGAQRSKASVTADSVLKIGLAKTALGKGEFSYLAGTGISTGFAVDPGAGYALVVSNGSTVNAGKYFLKNLSSVIDPVLFAYPNPCPLGGGANVVLFSRSSPATVVSIYSEAGELKRELRFDPDAEAWNWDLRDSLGRPVNPGLYYYRSEGMPLKLLVLL